MLRHKGTQWLGTERLRLCPLSPNYAEEMYSGWSGDNEVTKYLSWPTHDSPEVTKKILMDWSENYTSTKYYNWGIFLKENGKLIGTISFININDYKSSAEIGYVISKKYWNQGYASEAARRILEFGFNDIGFKSVVGYHHPRNTNSGKVMEKIGMKREGWLPGTMMNNKGQKCDVIKYTALRANFIESTVKEIDNNETGN
ncbi:MAG: GNAT family N-acetyltransferase [Oscillospiraceae bacterium]|nr:GNAT family N-acetyltransferase [Oscillospiraceae bacterium]